jgi:RimJ/RimL family protein N-acetyltransferase
VTDTVAVHELRTERLLLRRWRESDEAPMAAINRDPEVARFLNRPVDEAAVEGFLGLMTGHWEKYGFGPWVVESAEPETAGRFLGFAGLAHVPPFLAAAGPLPELGWRLERASWGRGLATEAAIAARDDAFARHGLEKLMSIIHPGNVRSHRVAAKIGMHRAREIENPVLGINAEIWEMPDRTIGGHAEQARLISAFGRRA